MKISQLLLKNFATVNEIKIDFKDGVTYLVGENGSGKTTCGLNAIWFVLEGIAKTGKKVLHADRFRFIGKYGKSAIGEITLQDEKEGIEIYLQRKMTKGTTTLNVAASDGRDLGPDFIDRIFNIFSINPEGFATLTPKEQATILGVDTKELDARKKVCYNQRRELGYDVKRISGTLEENGEAEEIESVDIAGLFTQRAQIEKDNEELKRIAYSERERLYKEAINHNTVQDCLQRDKDTAEYNIVVAESKIKRLQSELDKIITDVAKQRTKLGQMPEVNPLMDTDIPMPEVKETDTTYLIKDITEGQERNKKAIVWEKYKKLEKEYSDAVARHDKKDQEYQALEKERVEYLRSCNLPFANITINSEGGLEIDGRPFNKTYFSKGEILRAGIKMAAATNPELKYIFVPDAQSIDEKSRGILFAELVKEGFQVVAEMVGIQKMEGGHSILLKESRIVSDYEDRKNVL